MSDTSLRPSLPTSSSDFALPPSSSSAGPSSLSADDGNPLLYRFRRPSILAPKATYFSESRLSSPLVSSFSLPLPLKARPRRQTMGDESESDRERMWTDSSPSSSSENPTPPLLPTHEIEEADNRTRPGKRARSPSTPPRISPSTNMDIHEPSQRLKSRRASYPLKPPRILNLLAEESRPDESEVKSEAAFQRLVSSCSELPMQPRTPRAVSDRGRYPEEAGDEEASREETPSDDGEEEDATFAFLPSSSEPINIAKPVTPANSINGDDMFISESPGGAAMDIDAPSASPSVTSTPVTTSWRYTPPPTTSAVRSNKRKFDDRFDPYPSSSKRRAVSPSLTYLRESHAALVSPILSSRATNGTSRHPVPISIPTSTASSATSSPTISCSFSGTSLATTRPVSISSPSVMSSPTMRASIGLASPVLRPLPRTGTGVRRGDGEEREVEGAGEGVGGLSLG